MKSIFVYLSGVGSARTISFVLRRWKPDHTKEEKGVLRAEIDFALAALIEGYPTTTFIQIWYPLAFEKNMQIGVKMSLKGNVRPFVPQVFVNMLKRFRAPRAAAAGDGSVQDLDLYWTPAMAAILETWGEGNVWREIQFLVAPVSGRVLDIACGTGRTMEMLSKRADLELHGCDISDFLLAKAVARGLPADSVLQMDATKLAYEDRSFDYSYSIGSLEHFTEDGIDLFLKEASRVTKHASMNMIPVSRSQKNEGWLKTNQSFHNNSTPWWTERCQRYFEKVEVLDSVWDDDISTGIWLVCRH